jgi:acetyl-CoA carboxylase biotin carboxyl carrier protein
MGNSTPQPADAFDLRRIRQLVTLMEEHDLHEIDLRQAGTRIRLRRGAEPMVTAAPAARAADVSAAAAPAEKPKSDDQFAVLRSPMVGTFYISPNPEAPPYVKVGDRVSADTTVCIIEAMKVFNEIPAETAGQIVAVLVENGAPVEFGQPLFKIDPRA